MITNYDGLFPTLEIEDVRLLWDNCCRDLGIDPRLLKVYFPPRDETPWWNDPYGYPFGALFLNGDRNPEVLIFIYDFAEKNGFLGLMGIRETMYHELIHGVLRYDAEEEEVTWLAQRVNRRRDGWQYCRGFLRSRAFELNLGPPQKSWTLFQWAKRKRQGLVK